ncbi:hypothetical protein D6783_04460 [Candidatus Woesearchaeota archaeon]|nr:MAG: hypothetical protein D6783_04460 [Candidatus Woesearchaeota archaeon]
MKQFVYVFSVLVCFLVVLALPVASGRTYLDFESLELDVVVQSNVSLVPKGSSPSVSSVEAALSWVAADSYRQEVLLFETVPEGVVEDGRVVFSWEQPSPGVLPFREYARVRTKFAFLPVRESVSFPLREIDPSLQKYLEPSGISDVTPEIAELAFSLAEGKDDLFEVVFALADWTTRHIEYDLSTSTAKASLPSSWVLENRRGVCDELTSLFISLNRALGIPAKFVSGVSFTDLEEFDEPWGPHGWAEVYFPGVGWVPFDVTYGEYGYLDATHVKLKESVDASENAVEYVSKGRNVEMVPGELDIDVVPVKSSELIVPFVSLSASLFKDSVGFGSYNLLTLHLKNNHDHYASTQVFLSRTEGLDVEDDFKKSVLLAPFEEKTVQWLLRVKPNLKKGYLYTFPIEIRSPISNRAQLKLKARADGEVLSRRVFDDLLLTTQEAKVKPYSQFVAFTCKGKEEVGYVLQNMSVSCIVENKGDEDLSFVRICLEDECQRARIGAGESLQVSFQTRFSSPGIKTVVLRAYNAQMSKSQLVRFRILDEARVSIEDVVHPDGLGFDDVGEISFLLSPLSLSVPKHVRVEVVHDTVNEAWELNQLDGPKRFRLRIPGSSLSLKNSTFLIRVSFKDDLGKTYVQTSSFNIAPVNVSFLERLQLVVNRWWVKLFRR